MRISRRLVLGAATVSVLLIAWALLTMVTGTISTGRFPSPLQFWQSTKQILTVGYADGTLIQHALHSLKLVVMGFLVAIAVGVPLGLLMGWSRRAEALINPVFLLIRPIPPLAWIPLAILWLGLGDAAKMMVIFLRRSVPPSSTPSPVCAQLNPTSSRLRACSARAGGALCARCWSLPQRR